MARPRFPEPYQQLRAYIRLEDYEAAQKAAQRHSMQLSAFIRAALKAAVANPAIITREASRP